MAQPTRYDILIIGGGVIGTACAYYLARDGARVILVDKGRLGYGCSYGNAGLIVLSHVFPLPMPGVIRQSLKSMLHAHGPIQIRPRLSMDLLRWLWRFACRANERCMLAATSALSELAQFSNRLFDQFVQEHGRDIIKYRRDGTMYACRTEASFAHMREEMQILAELGWPGRSLDADETRGLNPALIGPLAGSTWFDQDAHVEPLAVVQAFVRLAEEAGASVMSGTEVYNIVTSNTRVASVGTSRGQLSADQYVLATGSWTPRLANQLRLCAPIQAGKGYAVIVEPFAPAPPMPTLLVDDKIAITPREGSVRIAGTLELAGLDTTVSPGRVRAMLRSARSSMNVPADVAELEVWSGLRPCTPDGLPMIGIHPRLSNLAFATGHAMLGLTLATGTGQAIVHVLRGESGPVNLKPFDPARF